MCNCIKEIEAKVHEKFPEYNKKKVVQVSADSVYILPKFIRRTYTNFSLQLDGQKKEVDIQINHSYCPFCGTKHPEPENE